MKRLPELAFLWLAVIAGLHVFRPSATAADSAPEVRPGSGVTAVNRLSNYLPSLANTPGDTSVYILEGREPGGTAFVAGGTHANEIAGVIAATVLIEHARVQKGRLIVVAHANNSGASYADPVHSVPATYTLKTKSGERQFRYGARLTKLEHQGERDPEKFRHPASSEDMDGSEARNLDRAYPGRADGNLTQRIAWAILQILKNESATLAFDLHESPPDSRLAWTVVAHPRSVDIAALAIIGLDAAGISMKLEQSPETFRGLSHREWGDATQAHAFLFETVNPCMGKRSAGADVVNDAKYPLTRRVGVHLAALQAVLDSYNSSAKPALVIKLQDVPGLLELEKSGFGAFLN